jgi:hypothetical protein
MKYYLPKMGTLESIVGIQGMHPNEELRVFDSRCYHK